MSNARHLNDSMGNYVGKQVIKLMNKKGILVKDARILILGTTFKEDCPDIRNTKVIDIYTILHEYSNNIVVYDPWVDTLKMKRVYGIDVETKADNLPVGRFDVVVLAVAHRQFLNMDIRQYLQPAGIIYDVKSVLPVSWVDGRL